MPEPSLAEFLSARIAEDQEIARRLMQPADDAWRWSPDSAFLGQTPDRHERAHIARWDPARVLAECEAKRRIIELFHVSEAPELASMGWQFMKLVLRELAAVYANHPDYDETWRPE